MKASSMLNHFDVTRSKCRQTKPIVWATLLILMSRHADRSSSSLYLANLRSMQYGCKFATVYIRKGYTWPRRFVLSRSPRRNSRVNCSCIVISRSCSCQCLLKPSHDSPSAVRSRKFFLERDLQSLLISAPRRQKDRGGYQFPAGMVVVHRIQLPRYLYTCGSLVP